MRLGRIFDLGHRMPIALGFGPWVLVGYAFFFEISEAFMAWDFA